MTSDACGTECASIAERLEYAAWRSAQSQLFARRRPRADGSHFFCTNVAASDASPQILRVAVRNGAAYEWIHHEHVGKDEGLTTEQLVYLRDLTRLAPPIGSTHPFNELQAAAFAFADESTRYSKLPDSTVERLKAALDAQLPSGVDLAQQMTEAMVTTGTYNMVSRFLLAADVGQHARVMTPLPAAHCQERTLYVAPGVTIYAYVVKHDTPKPWIVLVNSLMTDYTMWEGVMARLSGSYNILAYDQRGHGKVSPVVWPLPKLS